MIPCYIAGPFRGATAWDIAENVRRAETVHLAACRAGFASLCPHMNTANFQGECTDQFWLEMTLALMRLVHAGGGPLICLPGAWRTSSGTRGELLEAERIGMPCFEAPYDCGDDPHILRLAKRTMAATREDGSLWWYMSDETLGDWMRGAE